MHAGALYNRGVWVTSEFSKVERVAIVNNLGQLWRNLEFFERDSHKKKADRSKQATVRILQWNRREIITEARLTRVHDFINWLKLRAWRRTNEDPHKNIVCIDKALFANVYIIGGIEPRKRRHE